MKAVRMHEFGDPGVLVLDEVERPEPGPTEVLVRVHAAGVNPVDWKTRSGGGIAGVLGPPPLVLGWDASGVVEQLGFGVTRFNVGDQVFGMVRFPLQGGAYGEYLTAPSRHLARKPANLSHVEAASLPLAALTAWQALVDTADLRPGQTVLVHGAGGGVGHLAVQIAKSLGARVLGTASLAKRELVLGLGADDVVDYRAAPFTEAVQGVDVVLDTVGGDYVTQSVDAARAGGVVVTIPSGATEADIAYGAARRVRVTGLLVEPDHAALERIAALVEARRLRPEVDAVFGLPEVAKAHRAGEQGHVRGKLVVSVVTED